MLRFIQKTLALGRVEIKKNVANYIVNKKAEIRIIIEIFNNYPLNTHKHLNFLDFQKAFEIYYFAENNEDNYSKILNIKGEMNTNRTEFNMPHLYKYRITSN